jgi:hypothetical protein
LALQLGDRLAGLAEQDTAENKQDYEWEIHFWLDTFRLLESELDPPRRQRWQREIEKITRWFAGQVAYRLDFPRYQGSFIRTSTNHLALFASEVYLAGRVLRNKEWEELGGKALHRLAAEEQSEDGYWGEFTDHGPATNYNYITMTCVAVYYEHSRDPAAYQALRRATDFHKIDVSSQSAGRDAKDWPLGCLSVGTDRRADRQPVHAGPSGALEHFSRTAGPDRDWRQFEASAGPGHISRKDPGCDRG